MITSTDYTVESVTNQCVNHAHTIFNQSNSTLNSYGNKLNESYITDFSTQSDKVVFNTNNQINGLFTNKTSPTIDQATDIIETNKLKIEENQISKTDLYNASVSSYTTASISFSLDNVSDYTNSLISRIPNPLPADISTITNAVTAATSELVSQITTTSTNLINKFSSDISTIASIYQNKLTSMINVYSNLFEKTANRLKSSGDIIYDFYKRAMGESSTSPYIQTNVPNAKGVFKPNADILKNTPDSKIVLPNLKKDTNTVAEFVANPLAKLLGFVGSLIPSSKTKVIEEPKPTSNKAKYGDIQVKQMKGGSTKIQDQTPGNVRDIDMHPSGTYTAIVNDGSKNTKIAGNKQEIINGDWNITTDKDKVEIVVGDSKIEIRKDNFSNIKGNESINIDGTDNIVVKGDVSEDYKSNYNCKVASDYNESVGGNRTEKTGGNLNEKVTGNHTETVVGNLTINVIGNVNINSVGPATISSSSIVRVTAPKVSIG